jgi:hypothetical protein
VVNDALLQEGGMYIHIQLTTALVRGKWSVLPLTALSRERESVCEAI